MHVEIVAVGRMKAGPESELCERYLERARRIGRSRGFGGFNVREFGESRAAEARERMADEARALAAAMNGADVRVCLDGAGETVDSLAFADWLRGLADRGTGRTVFAIGGADGLDARIRTDSERTIALGRMTWPHQIVRILLAEQLYRAMTILGNHPYHRA